MIIIPGDEPEEELDPDGYGGKNFEKRKVSKDESGKRHKKGQHAFYISAVRKRFYSYNSKIDVAL